VAGPSLRVKAVESEYLSVCLDICLGIVGVDIEWHNVEVCPEPELGPDDDLVGRTDVGCVIFAQLIYLALPRRRARAWQTVLDDFGHGVSVCAAATSAVMV